MNTEALINLISKRVMEQLQKLESAAPPLSRKKVLVLGESLHGAEAGAGLELVFLRDAENARAEDFDHILIADLPNKLLGEMAMGLERGGEGCVIVEALMQGKTVHILEEGIVYRQFRDTAKPAFYKLFCDKEQTLISYGMEVLPAAQLTAVLAGGSDSKGDAKTGCKTCAVDAKPEPAVMPVSESQQPQDKGVLNLDKRVISERDVRNGFEQGYMRFFVGKKALVTPLANDFIRVKNLLLDRAC